MRQALQMLPLLLIPLLFISQTGLGQAPDGVNYQAVARDGSGNVLNNQSLTVRMTIKEGGPAGTTVYQETHNTSTNDFGLFDLIIGQGSVLSGTFSNINWGSNSHFLQVEVDDGSGYVNLGTSQFVSVPYALYAKEAGNAGTSYNAGTGIDISGNTISNTGDTDPSDDITNSSNAGGDISGNFNNLTVVGFQGRSVSSAAPGNGQVLKWNGSAWAPANDVGGGAGDNWGTQVVQSDATLTGDGTSGSPLSVDGDLTDDQTLSISGNNLSISGGNTVTLPGGGSGDITAVNAGIGLSGGGTSGSVTLDADHDNAIWNADELQGNTVSNSSPSSGEVLKWNGSAWAPGTDATGGGGTSPWQTSGSDIYYNDGNVGIGTNSPSDGLTLHASDNSNDLRIENTFPFIELNTTSGNNAGILFENQGGDDGYIMHNAGADAIFISGANSATAVPNLAVTSSGDVGIGTATPDNQFTVSGDANVTGDLGINETNPSAPLHITLTGTALDDGIQLRSSQGTNEDWYFYMPSNENLTIRDDASDVLTFENGSGNIGIGTTDPSEKLTVDGGNIRVDGSNNFVSIFNSSTSSSSGYRLYGESASFEGGLFYEPTDDVIHLTRNLFQDGIYIDANYQVGIGESTPSEDLEVGDADNSGTTTVQVGSGTDDGINIGSAEGILDGGINTLEFNNARLIPDNDNSRDLGSSSQAWQDIYSNDGVTITSDINAKKDVKSLPYGLNEVMALNPVAYKLKSDRAEDKPHLGLVAQDVLPVIGDVVKTHDWVRNEENGELTRQKAERMGINYTALIPVLINSIQEQQGQIEQLKNNNQQLQTELNDLKKRVEQLEK